jgi:hypothetical protein
VHGPGDRAKRSVELLVEVLQHLHPVAAAGLAPPIPAGRAQPTLLARGSLYLSGDADAGTTEIAETAER